MKKHLRLSVAAFAALALVLAGCNNDDTANDTNDTTLEDDTLEDDTLEDDTLEEDAEDDA
jgi:ABC-type uncharacterized transport system auxiliary subunit